MKHIVLALSLIALSLHAADKLALSNLSSTYVRTYSADSLIYSGVNATNLYGWNTMVSDSLKGSSLQKAIVQSNVNLGDLVKSLNAAVGKYIEVAEKQAGYSTVVLGLVIPTGVNAKLALTPLYTARTTIADELATLKKLSPKSEVEKFIVDYVTITYEKLAKEIDYLLGAVNLQLTKVPSPQNSLIKRGISDSVAQARTKRIDTMKGLYYSTADTQLLELNNALTTAVNLLRRTYGYWFNREMIAIPLLNREDYLADLTLARDTVRTYHDRMVLLAKEKTTNKEFQAILAEITQQIFSLEQEIQLLLTALRSV